MIELCRDLKENSQNYHSIELQSEGCAFNMREVAQWKLQWIKISLEKCVFLDFSIPGHDGFIRPRLELVWLRY